METIHDAYQANKQADGKALFLDFSYQNNRALGVEFLKLLKAKTKGWFPLTYLAYLHRNFRYQKVEQSLKRHIAAYDQSKSPLRWSFNPRDVNIRGSKSRTEHFALAKSSPTISEIGDCYDKNFRPIKTLQLTTPDWLK